MNNLKPLPPFKRWTLENFPFIEADFDAITNYQLYCKIVEYLKSIAENQNSLDEAMNYVLNYFNNLNVQDEVNAKLDEMAESGELTEIIAQYLSLAGIFGYNTISDMSEAVNLANNSICYTLGQNTYNDGKGAFYKIRTVTSGDVVDGFNIVALDVSETLIAERIPNYYINEINNELSNIEDDITNINTRVSDIRFVKAKNAYFSDLDITGTNNGLSLEVFYRMGNATLSIQGCAVNKNTGEILYNNGTEIYKLSDTVIPTKTNIQTGDYGHGGDCCIYKNNMYISDSYSNKIYAVNLSTGSKITYTLDNTKILNTEHSSYTPVLGGICMNNDDSYCFIVVYDEEDTGHTIKTESTVRLYKYDFNNSYEKLAEYEQDLCYIQGLTKDNDYFYFIGNKPFTDNYTGNKLYIIKDYTYEIYDVLENNINYEYEGIDYGSIKGCEGLITSCCKYNANMFFGLYSFYGNCSESIILSNTTNEKAYSVKSRGGIVTTYITLYGTFNQDTTYEFNNFFTNNYPLKLGAGGGTTKMYAISYQGSGRNCQAQGEWDLSNNKLILRTFTTTPSSTRADLVFMYVTE